MEFWRPRLASGQVHRDPQTGRVASARGWQAIGIVRYKGTKLGHGLQCRLEHHFGRFAICCNVRSRISSTASLNQHALDMWEGEQRAFFGLTYDGIFFAQLQRIGQVVQLLRVGFARGGEGQVGYLEAFVPPVLQRCGVEVRVFGCDDHAGLLRAVVPAEFHFFWEVLVRRGCCVVYRWWWWWIGTRGGDFLWRGVNVIIRGCHVLLFVGSGTG